MNESLLNRILKDHKRRTRSLALILCLSMIVSLGTFAGFHQTAIAKVYTREVLDCPYAHEGAEPVAHVHNDDCYEGETLVCTLPEREAHTHDDTCYAESRMLSCGLEENPGHQHSEACFDENGELTCQIPEGEGAHVHTDACYTIERALICNQPELPVHVHDAGCFRTEEITVDEPEETAASEQAVSTVPEMPVSDPNADLETVEDWNREFENLELSGNWARDLVLVAATQQGRGESPNNFEAVLNDAGDAWVRHGYTRYGAWYGYPYAEWDAMFVSFCLRYAGIPVENVPNNPTAAFMAESFQKGELFAGRDYIPAVGDLIFFDTVVDDEITNIDHMGIVYHVDTENGTINTVEGDRTDAVATFGYYLDDEQIVGYGLLPQNPIFVPTSPVFMTTDEKEEPEETPVTEETTEPAADMPAQSWERTAGGIKVSVEAPEGAFPENTQIAVTPVNGSSLKDTVSDAVDGAVLEVQAVDITFFDASGREIEPAVPIRVVMTPAATEHAEEKTSVVHVDIAQQTAELIEQAEGTETDNSEVVFDAEAFTIYAIVYTVDFEYEEAGEIYTATRAGGDEISLSELLAELNVQVEARPQTVETEEETEPVEDAEAAGIEETAPVMIPVTVDLIAEVTSTDEKAVTVTPKENDWAIRVLKNTDEKETILLSLLDGQQVGIKVNAEGVTESSSENEMAVISTVNALFLPTNAEAKAEVLGEEQSAAAIAAVQAAAEMLSAESAEAEKRTEQDFTPGATEPAESNGTAADADFAASGETLYQVFDISLENVDVEKYEDGFHVDLTLPETVTGHDFHLYHIHDDIVEELMFDKVSEETEDGSEQVTSVSFVTSSFSEFVLSYRQLTATVISAGGETWEITVTCGSEALIPDNAALVVTEILPESEGYQEYYDQASEVALGDAESQGLELPVVDGMRIFDIEIRTDEGKIEPAAPVQVDIRLVSAKAELLSVVHFAGDGAESMGVILRQPVEIEAEEESGEAPKLMTDAMSEAESMALNAISDDEGNALDAENPVAETADKPVTQTVNEVHFTTLSFSVYTVVSVNSDNANSLAQNGPYALVTGIAGDPGANVGYNETWGRDYFTKFVNAHAVNYNYGYTNHDGIASMGVHLWEEDGQGYVGGDVTEWYFENVSNANGNYYIYTLDENGGKRYIYQQGNSYNGQWHLNRNLAFTPAGDGGNWRSTFQIIPNSDGTVLIKNIGGNWYMHNNQYGSNEWESRNYMMDENPGANALASSPYKFRLSRISDDYDSYAAQKTSVQNVTADSDGNEYQYIIYRKFEDQTGNETLYAVAHDGSFVRVYDGGDTIYWRETEKELYWKYEQSNSGGHRLCYTDRESGEKVYINPSASAHQTMTADAVSLTLNGKDNGEYGTTIERWDQAAYDYAGLHVTKDGEDVALSAGTRGAGTSDEFLFAVAGEMPDSTQPEVVDTVDSESLGIHITMFDYGAANGNYNAGDKLSGMTNVIGTGSDAYTPHAAHALVRGYLSDGLPVSRINGNTLTGLFTANGSEVTTSQSGVNHLFLQSYYDESGTFRYRSEDNFAYLPGTVNTDTGAYLFTDNNFIVYRQAATPYTSNLAIGHTYYHHGHFMPYNNIDMNQNLARLMDQYGNAADAEDLPVDDGRTYDNIYGVQGTPNYYTGMMMEAAFSQPKGGKLDNGDDMIFKFTGDDDMWVYIDGVLVLDIGGIHEPLSGTINFATGVVTNPPGSGLSQQTTLKAIFDAALEDSNTPDDVKEKIRSIEWNGNTFADYGNHEFKSFYMERGAGASNLDIQFNLKVTLTDEFTVEKELPEDVDTRYINHKYKYKATFLDGTTEKPLYAGAVNSGGEVVCNQVVYKELKDDNDQPVPVDVDSDGYFYLRPGEVAVFKMKDETIAYNVTEVEIDPTHIDKVKINGAETNHETIISQNNTAVAGYATGRARSNVLFLNYPYLQNLLITKHLTEDSAPLDQGEDPRFEFRIYLETTEMDANGQEVRKMTYYSLAPYYLVKEIEGEEHYFTLTGPNNTPEDQGTEPVVCSTTGRTGTINSIPPDYTVIIPNLVLGTHFYVEEVITEGEIPEGYQYVRTDLTVDTYGEPESEVSGEKQGRIIKDKDADVHVFNKKQGIEITVEKVWEPLPTDPNASVTVQLHRYAKKTKGTIDVFLKDNSSIQAAVVGAVFKLQKQENDSGTWADTETTVTTDVNGKASVSHLEPGTYRLVQVSAPEGYSMDGHTTETQSFTVQDNVTTHQEHSETLYNTLLITSGSLTIKVVDSEDAPVAGANFTLYKDGTPFQTGLQTDENGMINVGRLDAGHYYVVQDQAPKGYDLPDSTHVGDFTVEEGHLGEDQHKDIFVTNVGKPKGKVNVTLTKSDDNQTISGATILLWQGNQVVESGVTDANGTVIFGGSGTILYEGSYTVQQEDTGSAGSDYYLADDVSVMIDPNGGSNQTIAVTMTDTPRGKGTVTVTVQTDGQNPVSNAEIELLKGEESFGSGTTDGNGQVVFSNVYEGTYTIRQIDMGSAGEGYRLAADETVEITTDGGRNQTKAVTLTDASKTRGTITVTLVDEKNSQTYYSGATIQLLQGNTVIESGTTDMYGNVTFGSSGTILYEGSYTVRQVTRGNAPEGYALAADQEVTISETGGQNQTLAVTLASGEASGNVTIKLWRKGGSGQWNWDLANTYTGLKAGKTYSFTAQFDSGMYPNNIWWYQDASDHQNSDSIEQGQLTSLSSGVNGIYRFTMTPTQDNTTYSFVLVSGWAYNNIYDMSMDKDSSSLSAPALSNRSAGLKSSLATAPTMRSMGSTVNSTAQQGSGAILRAGEGTRETVTDAVPAEAPDGYVEDSSFTPISYTITSTDNWTYTFPTQAKLDADGEPYYYYVVETACSEAEYWIESYTGDPRNENGTIAVKNVKKTGSIQVTKSFSGVNELPAGFQITNNYNSDIFTVSNATSGSGTSADPYVWMLTGINDGTTVSFTESGATVNGYTLTVTSSGTVISDSTVSATVRAGNTVTASLVNAYVPKTIDVTLKKVDKNDLNEENPNLLKGASFTLSKYESDNYQSKDVNWGTQGSKSLSDDKKPDGTYTLNGLFSFEGLSVGYYKIEETNLPAGYVKWSSDPTFEVKANTSNELMIRLINNPGNLLKLVDGELTIFVGNTPGTQLPQTGGIGTTLFTAIGGLMTATAGAILAIRKKRETA